MKPALLVVDVQKEYYKNGPGTAQSIDAAIAMINAAIALFRKKQLPVVCIQDVDAEINVVPGQEGFDLPDQLNILPADLHVHKTYKNAFNKTALADELQKLGVDTVIVCGYCAEFCVLTTYRGAEDLDLAAILLRGGIASDIAENITFVESINEVISLGALERMLD
jgi:nicotinamidase-related amidase